jgi:hypothetical protein
MAQARLDKSPRRGAKQKRIKTLLHEDDDLICQIPGGHIVEIVRCCFVGVRFGFHLIQPLRFADFNSCCSRELTGAIHGSFRMGALLVHSRKLAARSHLRAKWEDHVVLTSFVENHGL